MHTRASQRDWLLWTASFAVASIVYAGALLLTGCRQEPTFYANGVPVLVEGGEVDQGEFECTMRAIFANSAGRGWAVIDAGTWIIVDTKSLGRTGSGKEIGALYDFNDLRLRADIPDAPAPVLLVHEMAHAMSWLTTGDPDDLHHDLSLFTSPWSLEKTAGELVRGVCL